MLLPCVVPGCGDKREDHVASGTLQNPGPTGYCRACFDKYPNDDSGVEGGVYHEYRAV